MKKIKQYILAGTLASTLLVGSVASAAGTSPLWLRNYLNGTSTSAGSTYSSSTGSSGYSNSSGSYGSSYGSPTAPSTSGSTTAGRTTPTPAPTQTTSPAVPSGATANLSAEEQTLFRLLNESRASRGLQPLKINAALSELARVKAKDMADNNYFSHTSPTYGKAGDMVRKAGIGARMVGENIAITSGAERANALFMGSSVHRSAMLNRNYTDVGIGMYRKSNGSLYVTEIFMQAY